MNKPVPGSPNTVPFEVTEPDRIAAQRYYDEDFYKLECEMLWPRVWQMACRLEEIPKPGSFSVYENLGQSIIVTRVDENTVKAFHNHCRHRGVKLANDRGRCNAFVCRFHGWSWNLKGENTFVYTPEVFSERQLNKEDLKLRECRVETWGGCAFINLDDNAPPLRDCIEPFATMHDVWHVEGLKVEWWYAAHLPVNWKLAMEAFFEGYHIAQTHPQQLPPGQNIRNSAFRPLDRQIFPMANFAALPAAASNMAAASTMFDPRMLIKGFPHFYQMLRDGMAGMVGEQDIQAMRDLENMELPARDLLGAIKMYNRALHDAITERNRKEKLDTPDLNEVMDREVMTSVNFCFPHFFMLPTYSAAASYRIRPLGSEECLFEVWSLKRYPEGEEQRPIQTPVPLKLDDPSWPPFPRQDFSNMPRQQQGLHTKGFEFMRLSKDVEGLISNNHRVIDGFLAGLGYDKLVPAMQKVSGPIDVPIKDLGF
ncbi:MAG TPA: aromatic ring-hydroxylating dioxygenase subunit alpha [Terriglobia bacterium]|jgi:nitrite reductase/ring-hydroxylating ferredoxin subunit